MVAALDGHGVPAKNGAGMWSDRFAQEWFAQAVERHGVQLVIELGTHVGDGSLYFARKVPYVITIEIHDPFRQESIAKAVDKLGVPPQIHGNVTRVGNMWFVLGSTPIALREEVPSILESIGKSRYERVCTWHDAHWQEYWPLKDELIEVAAMVSSGLMQPPLLMIHDWRTQWDNLGYDSYGGIDCSWENFGEYVMAISPTYVISTNGPEAEGHKRGILRAEQDHRLTRIGDRVRRAGGDGHVRKVLISFGSEGYELGLASLARSASPYFDEVICYRHHDIDPSFRASHARHFADRRGYGYWIWKPYFLLKTMERVAENDIVMYCDALMTFISDPAPLFAMVQENDGILVFNQKQQEHKNYQWTRKDTFTLMGCDTADYLYGDNLHAAFMLYQKKRRAIEFIREWLSWLSNYQVVADTANITGPNHPEFRSHRHDQSVLSLLTQKHDIRTFIEISQWGAGYPGARYPQIVDHHRRK